MKRMQLGAKIVIGFGLMIMIVLALGITALWNAKRMEAQSDRLTSKYMPEVQLSGSVERYSLLSMYDMRGFELSGEVGRLDEARLNLGKEEAVDKYDQVADGEKAYVDAGQSNGPPPDFKDNEDGTVTDLTNNVMWHKGDDQNTNPFTWSHAAAYCDALRPADHSDWRLPGIHELLALVKPVQHRRPHPGEFSLPSPNLSVSTVGAS